VTLTGTGNAQINFQSAGTSFTNQGTITQATSGRGYNINRRQLHQRCGRGSVSVSQANSTNPGLTITAGSLSNAAAR